VRTAERIASLRRRLASATTSARWLCERRCGAMVGRHRLELGSAWNAMDRAWRWQGSREVDRSEHGLKSARARRRRWCGNVHGRRQRSRRRWRGWARSNHGGVWQQLILVIPVLVLVWICG
jgi:hypothetical protein